MAKKVSSRVANARAAAEKAKKKLAEIEREEREAERDAKRAARSQQARSELAEGLYALLGIAPEPPRQEVRVVTKDGARIEQPVSRDRDPQERARTRWALKAVELLVKDAGDDYMCMLRDQIERNRQSARDADDAARAERARARAGSAAPPAAAPPTAEVADEVGYDPFDGQDAG